MKRRILCFVLTMAMVLSMLVVLPAVTVSADTYNASDNPVLITTRADLKALRDDVNNQVSDFSGKTIKLMADIDISDADWTPIGDSGSKPAFKGNFDGQGHTISGLTQTRNSQAYAGDVGLFGYVQAPDGGSIYFKDVYLKGKTSGYNIALNKGCVDVGTFISKILPNSNATTATISGVWSSIRLDVSSSNGGLGVGGILGTVPINSSMAAITVNIDSCWFSGYLNSTSAGSMIRYGGIVGYVDQTGSSKTRTVNVSNCLVTNDGSEGVIKVNNSGADDIGGIVGFYRGGATGSIKNCIYAATMWNSAGSSHIGYVLGEITGSPSSNIDMTNTYYVASYNGTAPVGYYGYSSSGYISNVPTAKTMDQIKAMTNGFSDNSKWNFTESGKLPVPAEIYNNSKIAVVSALGLTVTLSSQDDFDEFVSAINRGLTFSGATVKLGTDVTLTTTVGATDSGNGPWFSGNFNGQGHTVALAQTITDPDGNGGLFSMVRVPENSTITIQNVRLTGTINLTNTNASNGYVGALISCLDAGTSGSGGTLNVTNVWNTVRINCGQNSQYNAIGGMIGFLRHNAGLKALTVNMDSCVWDGVINCGPALESSGGLIGYTGNQAKTTKNYINVSNTVVAGTIMLNTNYSDDSGLVFGYLKGNGSNPTDAQVVVTVSNVVSIGKITSSVNITSGKWIGMWATSKHADDSKPKPSITITNFFYRSFDIPGLGTVVVDPGTGTAGTTGTATVKTARQIYELTTSSFSNASKWNKSTGCYPCPAGIYSTFGEVPDSLKPDIYDVSDAISISTTDEFLAFRDKVNGGNNMSGKTITLTADIDLADEEWVSIGVPGSTNSSGCKSFQGTFNGQGYTIKNMTTFLEPTSGFVDMQGGLFSSLGDGAVVKDFNLTGTYYIHNISTSAGTTDYFGSVANAVKGTVLIQNVHSSVNITTKVDKNSNDTWPGAIERVGGLVGFIYHNCSANLTIDKCEYSGTINVGNQAIDFAGIMAHTGTNSNSSTKVVTISDCSFTGRMTVNENSAYAMQGIAGIISHVTGNATVTITGTYSAGKIYFNGDRNWPIVDGDSNPIKMGQILGYNEDGTTVNIDDTVVYAAAALLQTKGDNSTRYVLPEAGRLNGTYCVDTAAVNGTMEIAATAYDRDGHKGIRFTASFTNKGACTGGGSASANFGIFLMTKVIYDKLGGEDASYSTINAAAAANTGSVYKVYAMKYRTEGSAYTVNLVVMDIDGASVTASELVAIPYAGDKLGDAVTASYNSVK